MFPLSVLVLLRNHVALADLYFDWYLCHLVSIVIKVRGIVWVLSTFFLRSPITDVSGKVSTGSLVQ